MTQHWTETVELNGEAFFIRHWGDKDAPKLLMLHGFPEYSGAWNDLAPLLAEIVAAGGTGGHMFPAQAFADEMHARGWTVALVTDERGAKYATNFPADWRLEVEAATFGSKMPHKLLSSAMKLRKGTAEARKNFEKTRPSLIAGFGGYPSYPSLSAARAMGEPIITASAPQARHLQMSPPVTMPRM